MFDRSIPLLFLYATYPPCGIIVGTTPEAGGGKDTSIKYQASEKTISIRFAEEVRR